MKEKKIENVLLRYSQKYNVWVNKEGTRVYREYKNKDYNKFLQIHKRTDGSKYLFLTFPGIVEVDLLVADCYNPKPCDGKEYVFVHKFFEDGRTVFNRVLCVSLDYISPSGSYHDRNLSFEQSAFS